MKKKLKDLAPYLIVAQTAMLATITGVTIAGALSTNSFECRMVGQGQVICIQR